MEIWKDVSGYEGYYQVSNFGRVKSVKRAVTQWGKKRNYTRVMRECLIRPRLQNSGYLIVRLNLRGKCTAYTVHRLVALHFLPNADSSLQVNHKDGDKQNNCVTNLEWVSRSENVKHSYRALNHKRQGKSVRCIETGIVFCSAKQAEQNTGVSARCIYQAAGGYHHTAGGFKWEWVEN